MEEGKHIGYIPLYDKMGDGARVVEYWRVDAGKVWNHMMTHLPPRCEAEEIAKLCVKWEGDGDGNSGEQGVHPRDLRSVERDVGIARERDDPLC